MESTPSLIHMQFWFINSILLKYKTKKRVKSLMVLLFSHNHYYIFCAFYFSLLIFKKKFRYVLSTSSLSHGYVKNSWSLKADRPGFDFGAYHLQVMWPGVVHSLLCISVSSSIKWDNSWSSHRIFIDLREILFMKCLAFCGLYQHIIHCLIFSHGICLSFCCMVSKEITALFDKRSPSPHGECS